MKYFQRYLSNFENFAIFSYVNREIGFSIRTKYNRCAGYFAEINVTTYKVRMKMRLKNILDGSVSLLSQVNVFINVPQRIYDSRFSFALNVIGCFTQAVGIYLFNKHLKIFTA